MMSESVNNCRIHGRAHYPTAVVHGGPAAAGEMAPVARELARDCGILEPLKRPLRSKVRWKNCD